MPRNEEFGHKGWGMGWEGVHFDQIHLIFLQ